MTTVPHWPFYADSLLFQSPDPREIPVPMFHEDGSFLNSPWTLKQPRKKVRQLEQRFRQKNITFPLESLQSTLQTK